MTIHDRRLELMLGLIFVSAAIAANLVDPMLYLVVVVHLFALPALAYPAVYRNSPWRVGPTGKALMNKARSVALLFAVLILGYWRHPVPGYEYIFNAVTTYFGLSISYQFLVMYRLKRSANEAAHAQEMLDQRLRPYTREAQ